MNTNLRIPSLFLTRFTRAQRGILPSDHLAPEEGSRSVGAAQERSILYRTSVLAIGGRELAQNILGVKGVVGTEKWVLPTSLICNRYLLHVPT